MKHFLLKIFFLISSLIIGLITTYSAIELLCINQSSIAMKIKGASSPLYKCHAATTIPASVLGLMVGILISYILFKIKLGYSFRLFAIFLLKLVLYAAVVWGLTILLYNPISAFICDLTAPKIERATEGLVVLGNWEGCYGIGGFVKSLGAASLVSAGITSCIYVLLTKWSQKKKKP